MPVYFSETSCGAKRLPWQLKVSALAGYVCVFDSWGCSRVLWPEHNRDPVEEVIKITAEIFDL